MEFLKVVEFVLELWLCPCCPIFSRLVINLNVHFIVNYKSGHKICINLRWGWPRTKLHCPLFVLVIKCFGENLLTCELIIWPLCIYSLTLLTKVRRYADRSMRQTKTSQFDFFDDVCGKKFMKCPRVLSLLRGKGLNLGNKQSTILCVLRQQTFIIHSEFWPTSEQLQNPR